VKHGAARVGRKTAEYRIWCAMRERCNSKNHVEYPRYGGRGVLICDRWNSFENFLADMGERPSAEHSIDRIDVNGNYEPTNCRWASKSEQARNKRTSVLMTLNGETRHRLEWAERLNLSVNTIKRRQRMGDDDARALRTVLSKNGRY
jgi:hypothetical protein